MTEDQNQPAEDAAPEVLEEPEAAVIEAVEEPQTEPAYPPLDIEPVVENAEQVMFRNIYGGSFDVAEGGSTVPAGDGVMHIHDGYYIVYDDGGDVLGAYPPERFYEAYPEFAPEGEA